jgi:hypothetical protein
MVKLACYVLQASIFSMDFPACNDINKAMLSCCHAYSAKTAQQDKQLILISNNTCKIV